MRLALLLALLPCAVRAEIHEWKDEKGAVHYSSQPPKGPAAKKSARVAVHSAKGVRVVTFTGPAQPAAPPTEAGAAPPPAQKSRQPQPPVPGAVLASHVELYTTSWCNACKAAREHLDSRGVRYIEHDVETDPLAFARYASYDGRGVPLAVIDGTAVRGFSPQMYDRLLEKR